MEAQKVNEGKGSGVLLFTFSWDGQFSAFFYMESHEVLYA